MRALGADGGGDYLHTDHASSVISRAIVRDRIGFDARASDPADADGLAGGLRRAAEAGAMLLEERLDLRRRRGPPSMPGLVERHLRQAYLGVTALGGRDRQS